MAKGEERLNNYFLLNKVDSSNKQQLYLYEQARTPGSTFYNRVLVGLLEPKQRAVYLVTYPHHSTDDCFEEFHELFTPEKKKKKTGRFSADEFKKLSKPKKEHTKKNKRDIKAKAKASETSKAVAIAVSADKEVETKHGEELFFKKPSPKKYSPKKASPKKRLSDASEASDDSKRAKTGEEN
jgi:hypothetical protein